MPRAKRFKSTDDPEYESRMQAALDGLREGRYSSYSEASRIQRVARHTLTDRATGNHRPHRDAHAAAQLLDPEQEQVLVDWAQFNANAAIPYSHVDLSARAFELTNKHPGKLWSRRFAKRHAESLTSAMPSGLDPKRAQNFNKATISHYFTLLKSLYDLYGNISPQNIWNMDEKGIQLGGGRKHIGVKYFFPRHSRLKYRIQSDNLELVTIVECVSAAGVVMPPGVILSDGPYPDPIECEGVGSIGRSPSGWTDRELTLSWFKEVFIPNARAAADPRFSIVLTLDGHDSHETNGLKRVAYDNDITVLGFPSKTTNKTQLLDVVVFSTVQRAWYAHCQKRLMEGISITRYNVIKQYLAVHSAVMTPDIIRASFRKTGIYACNENVFSDWEFLPSMSSLTTAHVPASYPTDIPSSPLATSSNFDDEDSDSMVSSDLDYHDDDTTQAANDSGSDVEEDPEDYRNTSAGTEFNASPIDLSDFDMEAPPSPDAGAIDCFLQTAEHPTSSRSFPAPTPTLNTLSSRYHTRSSPVTAALNKARSDALKVIPISHDEELSPEAVLLQLRLVRTQNSMLLEGIAGQEAALTSANAHCTVMRREAENLRVQLENAKLKGSRCGGTRSKARFLTHRDQCDDFEVLEAAEAEKERENAQNEARKAIEQEAHTKFIEEQTRSREFSNALPTYNRYKDDLIILAGALRLSTTGIKADLLARIKEHLDSNPGLKESPRFCALFIPAGRKRPQDPVDSQVEDIPANATLHPALPSSAVAAMSSLSTTFQPHAAVSRPLPHFPMSPNVALMNSTHSSYSVAPVMLPGYGSGNQAGPSSSIVTGSHTNLSRL